MKKTIRKNHSKGQSFKDQARTHQFGKKVLPGIFLRFELIAEGIWQGDILVADSVEMENLVASEIHPRRLNAKDVLTPKKRVSTLYSRSWRVQ